MPCLSNRRAFGAGLVVWLLAAPGGLAAQTPTTLTGVVRDRSSGEGLPYAQIRQLSATGTANGVAADDEGRFRLPLGESGAAVVLIASSIGYDPDTLRPAVGERIVFRLVRRALELPGVTVEAQRSGERATSQAGVTRLTARDNEQTPIVGEPDVLRALERVPGVTMLSGYNVRPYLRGSTGDQTAFQLNGVTLYNPYHLFSVFSAVDADLVSSLTVTRGVLPIEQEGRLGGLIAVDTRDGTGNRPVVRAQLSLLSAKASLEGPISPLQRDGGHASYLVSLRRTYLDWLAGLAAGNGPNPVPYQFDEGYAQLFWRDPSDTRDARLFGFLSRDRWSPADPQSDAADFGIFNWRNHALGLRLRKRDNDGGETALNVSWSGFVNHTVRRYEDAPAVGDSSVFYRQRIDSGIDDLTARLTSTRALPTLDRFGTGGWTGTVGAEAQGLRLRYEALNAFGQTDRRTDEPVVGLSAFAGLAGRGLHDRLQLDAGLRATHYGRLTGIAVAPRFGARLLVDEAVSLTAGLGWQYQALTTLNDEDDLLTLFEAWTRLPDGNRPSRSRQMTLGLTWTPPARPVSFGLDLYHKRLDRLSRPNRFRTTPADPVNLSGEGWAYGAELSGRYQPTERVQLDLSYTLARSIYAFDALPYPYGADETYRLVRYYPRFDRTHHLNLLLAWQPGTGRLWDVSAQFTAGSGLPTTDGAAIYDLYLYGGPQGVQSSFGTVGLTARNARRLPITHRLDVSLTRHLSYRHWRGDLFLSVYNVYNQRNAVLAVPPSERPTYTRVTGVPDLPFLPTLGFRATF